MTFVKHLKLAGLFRKSAHVYVLLEQFSKQLEESFFKYGVGD